MDAVVPLPFDEEWVGSLIPDSLIVTDESGTVIRWNAGAEALYGYSVDDAMGHNLDQLLATRHPFGTAYLIEKLDRTGRWEAEIFRTTADGRAIGLRAHRARNLRPDRACDEQVEWSRLLADNAAQDVTAHRYTNLFNAMAASFWELDFSLVRQALGELFAQGVEDVPAFLLANPDWIDRVLPLVRVLDVNAKTLELFAIPDKQTALDHPMDWAWPAQSRDVFARSLIAALRRDDRFTTETMLQDRDGTPIDALFTVCWPSEHKARGSVLVGVIDLTETKRAFRAVQESERHYRDLFRSMPVALLRVDLTGLNRWIEELPASGDESPASYLEAHPELSGEINRLPRIVDANPEAIRLFRVSGLDDLQGSLEWTWQDRPGTLRRSLLARLRGASEFSEETRITLADGTPVDVLFVISFAQDRVDRGFNVVGLVDITGRKIAEQELQQAREELSHAARVSMLGELTASIAHEVNQPLAAISALADASLRWLDRPTPDLEEVRTLAGDIASDARRASEIIHRIRALAVKQSTGSENVDLNELIGESLLILRHDCDARGITTTTRLAPDQTLLRGDRIQLQQVIVNLMVNAMQAMDGQPAEPRAILIGTRLNDEGQITLTIEDSGPGIAPGNMDRLFDSFFTTKGSGMGLGLSVCRTIVEAHGGTIRAENAARGARFLISLPSE